MPRRADPAMIADAIRDVESGALVPDVAARFGIAENTLYRALRRRQPLAEGSFKDTLLRALDRADGPLNIADLQRIVGGDRHSLVHLVWSLQKQAAVTFTLRHDQPTRIEITDPGRALIQDAAGARGTDVADEPTIEPTTHTSDLNGQAPAQPLDEWPELRRIQRRSEAILAAARALTGVDGLEPLAALVAEAADGLTPAEHEYLRFANAMATRIVAAPATVADLILDTVKAEMNEEVRS